MASIPNEPPALDPQAVTNVPTWRAAYSDRTSAMMALFCQYAYLPFEVSPPKPEVSQPKAERPGGRAELAAKLQTGGFTLVEVFNRDDTQAFFAVNHDQFAVLAFRGTTTFQDWRTNLNAGLVPMTDAPAVKVHAGFLSAFNCCRTEIVKTIDANVPSDLGLYITGHSLGGALAQIASAELERDNLAACYTYGSPRVGHEDFDRLVKCPHYRVVNNWDLVPGVPPPWYHAYRHSGDPRLLTPAAKGQEALRRDRWGPARFVVDLLAGPRALIAKDHSWLAINDHMIWNYQRQLAEIAQARTIAPPSRNPTPEPTP